MCAGVGQVFVLAIIVSVIQLQPLSQFIIGDKCKGINGLLQAAFDKQLNGDDKVGWEEGKRISEKRWW